MQIVARTSRFTGELRSCSHSSRTLCTLYKYIYINKYIYIARAELLAVPQIAFKPTSHLVITCDMNFQICAERLGELCGNTAVKYLS